MRFFPPGVEVGPAMVFTMSEGELLIEVIEARLDQMAGDDRQPAARERGQLLEILKYFRNEYPPTL